MAEPISLTPDSFLDLGLVGEMRACTPYEMKQFVSRSVGYFWSFPHSQLYAEPSRLAAAGLLDEDVEPAGRRRKTYRLTRDGRSALARWLAEPSSDPTEIRDLGLLKLFFGGQTGDSERRALAAEQHRSHDERRSEYEQLRKEVADLANPHQLATLEMGLRYERAMTAFWKELLTDDGA